MPEIEWRHDGRRIVIPVAILRADDPADLSFHPATALIDTGATSSGIMPSVVEALDLAPVGKRLVKAAHGEAMLDTFVFRVGLFPKPSGNETQPSFPYIFDAIMGLRFGPSEHFDAIVGMDILGQCDFSAARNRNCRLAFG
jgi:hypothetical protein